MFPSIKPSKKLIYLDHAATTPLDPRVKKAMEPFWTKEYGNPSSIYSLGKRAHLAVENSRRTVADCLNAKPSEIIFTADDNGMAKFKVYNMIGTAIKEYDIWAKKGINKLEIDAKDYDSGVYFYSLSYGNNAFTRKMIIKK